MNKIVKMFAAALLIVAACQKTEVYDNNAKHESSAPDAVLSVEKALIKSMLADRDTRWTEDDLDIPEVSGEWNLIANEKELAFLLEFGCAEGGKYRLENDLNLASSEIAEKFTSEIGIEKFVNFEFDVNVINSYRTTQSKCSSGTSKRPCLLIVSGKIVNDIALIIRVFIICRKLLGCV